MDNHKIMSENMINQPSVDERIDVAKNSSFEQKQANTVLQGKDIEENKAVANNGTVSFEKSDTLKVTEPHLKGAFDMQNDPINPVHTDVIETPVVIKEVRVINEGVVTDEAFLAKFRAQPEVTEEKYQAKVKELKDRKAANNK